MINPVDRVAVHTEQVPWVLGNQLGSRHRPARHRATSDYLRIGVHLVDAQSVANQARGKSEYAFLTADFLATSGGLAQPSVGQNKVIKSRKSSASSDSCSSLALKNASISLPSCVLNL